jgi:hypothetical protein
VRLRKKDLPVNLNLERIPHNHTRLDHTKSDPRGKMVEQYLQRLIQKIKRNVYRVVFRSIPNRGAREVDLSKLRNNQVHDEKR